MKQTRFPEELAERLRSTSCSTVFATILEREVLNQQDISYEIPRDIKKRARDYYTERLSNPYLEEYAKSCLRKVKGGKE